MTRYIPGNLIQSASCEKKMMHTELLCDRNYRMAESSWWDQAHLLICSLNHERQNFKFYSTLFWFEVKQLFQEGKKPKIAKSPPNRRKRLSLKLKQNLYDISFVLLVFFVIRYRRYKNHLVCARQRGSDPGNASLSHCNVTRCLETNAIKTHIFLWRVVISWSFTVSEVCQKCENKQITVLETAIANLHIIDSSFQLQNVISAHKCK